MIKRSQSFVVFSLFLVACVSSASAAAPAGETVNNFSLRDHHGKFHTLDHYRDQKAVVIVVGGNGCPIVRKSIPYLNDLQKQFAEQGVVFLMLNANPQDDHDSIVQEAKDFGIEWPILEDQAQVAASSLKAVRTAEAFILDPRTWTVVYRGPIHDKLGYESERPAIKEHYLKDHLTAFLKGALLDSPVPAVKGCLINFTREK